MVSNQGNAWKILLSLSMIAAIAVLPYYGMKWFAKDRPEKAAAPVVTVQEPECAMDRITEEYLDSFQADTPYAPGTGNSRPIDIQPLPEVHISAQAGAFESDPEIRVRELSGKEMQMVDEQVQRMGMGERTLWAFDIDAGLAPDEVIPGKYTIEIDLEKLGVPEELYPYVDLIRMDGESLYRPLNTQVKDGILRCEASQNSILTTCIAGGIILAGGAYYIFNQDYYSMSYDAWAAAGYPLKFWKTNDLVKLRVKDKFGDFDVYFRYSETENCARTKEYVEKATKLSKRSAEIYRAAAVQYAKEHLFSLDLLTDNGLIADWSINEAENKGIIAGICRIANQMMDEDPLVTSLRNDPDMAVPESVENIIKGCKMANRFLRTVQKLKPVTYAYPIFIVKGESSVAGKRMSAPILGSNISVSWIFYLKPEGDKLSLLRDKLDGAMVSVAHETFHIYQIEYITTSLLRDMRFFEATGSVVEHLFAAWMKKQGVFQYDDIEKAPLGYSERDVKEFLNWPLAKNYPGAFDRLDGKAEEKNLIEKAVEWYQQDANVAGGYMLGDLFQYLQENKKKVTLADMMAGYAYHKSIVRDLMDIYGIETEAEFAKYYEGFCLKYMDVIIGRTGMYNDEEKYKNLVIPKQTHDSKHPLMCLDRLGHDGTESAYPFAVKPVQIMSTEKHPYNLWAYPSSFVKPAQLKFGFLTEDKKDFAKDRFFIKPCEKGYQDRCDAAVFYRPAIAGESLGSSYYYIDIVAYYQPAQAPKVLGETRDGGGLSIHTGEAPNAELVERHYLAGMQLAVTNNATGKKKTFTVPLEKCGKEVKLPYAEIGITDPQDIDITLLTRWYNTWGEEIFYSPATEKVNYKVAKKKEAAPEPEKKPEKAEEEPSRPEEDFTEPSGDVDTDKGPVLIEQNIRLSGVGDLSLHSMQVYGHIVVKQKSFTLTVPAISMDTGYSVSSMDGFSVKGKVEKITDAYVTVDLESLKISPETLVVTSHIQGSTPSTLTKTCAFAGNVEGSTNVYLKENDMILNWKVNISYRSVELPGNNQDYPDQVFYVQARFSL